jgi:hypothetical protein
MTHPWANRVVPLCPRLVHDDGCRLRNLLLPLLLLLPLRRTQQTYGEMVQSL